MSFRLLGLAVLVSVFSFNSLAESKKNCKDALGAALSTDWVAKKIKDIKSSETRESKIIKEAIQSVGLQKATLNREVYNNHNVNYTNKVFEGEVIDQGEAGTCWIFSRLNVYRSKLINEEIVDTDFEFSSTYLFFFHLLEKTNSILENNIIVLQRNRDNSTSYYDEARGSAEVSEGGYSNFFPFLVDKYGLVPKSAMADTISSKDSEQMLGELKNRMGIAMDEMHKIHMKAMKDGLRLSQRVKLLRASKQESMDSVMRVLITHLGEPPTKFDFYKIPKESQKNNNIITKTPVVKDITPKEFATKIVKITPDDFVFISSVPGYLPGHYKSKRSSLGMREKGDRDFDLNILNLPIERLEELIITAIDKGIAVEFDADIDKDIFEDILHTEILKRDGVYGLTPEQENKKLSRSTSSYYKVSEVQHAMVFTGYDRPGGKGTPVLKFLVQNSWGDSLDLDEAINPNKPYTPGDLHMYRNWLLKHVFAINIPKGLLSKEEIEMLKAKPKQLSEQRF